MSAYVCIRQACAGHLLHTCTRHPLCASAGEAHEPFDGLHQRSSPFDGRQTVINTTIPTLRLDGWASTFPSLTSTTTTRDTLIDAFMMLGDAHAKYMTLSTGARCTRQQPRSRQVAHFPTRASKREKDVRSQVVAWDQQLHHVHRVILRRVREHRRFSPRLCGVLRGQLSAF